MYNEYVCKKCNKKYYVEEIRITCHDHTEGVYCPYCEEVVIKPGSSTRDYIIYTEEEHNIRMAKEKEEYDKAIKCPICGARMVERMGQYGKFMGCTNFPRCKGTRKIEDE